MPAAETWTLPALPNIDRALSLLPQLVYIPVMVTGQVCNHSKLGDGAQKLGYVAKAAGRAQGTQDSDCLLTVMFIAVTTDKNGNKPSTIEW